MPSFTLLLFKEDKIYIESSHLLPTKFRNCFAQLGNDTQLLERSHSELKTTRSRPELTMMEGEYVYSIFFGSNTGSHDNSSKFEIFINGNQNIQKYKPANGNL